MTVAADSALLPRDPPRLPGWPLVGDLPPLLWHGALNFFERCWKRHGDTFRLRLGGSRVVVFAHPSAVEEIFVSKRDNFIKGKTFHLLRVLSGDGVLTLEGDAWRKRRRLAQPSFHKDAIRTLVRSMVDVTRDALDDLQRRVPSGAVMEAHREMLHLTLDVAGQTLLGSRMAGTSADAFGGAFAQLSHRGNVVFALPDWIPTPGNRRLRKALTTLDVSVYKLIAAAHARAAAHAQGQAEPPEATLLSMLMASRDADSGQALSYRELRDEVITLLLAGHETTALLMTWAFALLGSHPEVVTRMRAEVAEVLGEREPSAEDLPRLTYLQQVIEEILRLRPPVWVLPRDVVADDMVAGCRVRAGDTVMPMPYLTHRHPDFWEEPDRFDPERFHPDRQKTRNGKAYYPFSVGPRTCIGYLFTLAEAKVVLAMLLQRADFDVLIKKPVPPKPMITLHPGAPVPVKLRWFRDLPP